MGEDTLSLFCWDTVYYMFQILFLFLFLIIFIFYPSVLWHCWLGDKKHIWPVRNSASEHRGMAINVSGLGTAQSTLWVQSFALEKDD